jgi:AcrR family transcriptional regulator
MTKRDDICDAALELFAEKGIEATTTREIAERAGAAEGTLYRHFDGKADLAQWLYRRCAGQLESTLTEAADARSGPDERLDALIRGVFDFYSTKPASCTYLLSTQDSGVVGSGDAEGLSPPVRLFADVLDEGMRQGVFREATASLVAGWILALVQRTVLGLKAGSVPLQEQTAIDRTVDAARRLLMPDPD